METGWKETEWKATTGPDDGKGAARSLMGRLRNGFVGIDFSTTCARSDEVVSLVLKRAAPHGKRRQNRIPELSFH